MSNYEETYENKKLKEEVLITDFEDSSLSEELMEILLNTREQGQIMEQLIKNQIEIKDEMINKLYKELESYKKEASEKYVEQVMKQIIKVRKEMRRNIFSDSWNNISAEEIKKEYRYILEDLTDLLEQQNISSYFTEEGEEFNPSIHEAKIEKTNEDSLDKKIKMSTSEGYKKADKILQPEKVIVYKYMELNK